MNEWTQQSIELARHGNYLDQLSQIYAIPHELRRPINQEIRRQISELFEKRDKAGLIQFLLRLKKFPFQDPYIGSLRAYEDAIARNPQTVERITRILYTMGLDKLIEGLEEPPQPNRQLGTLFKKWLRALGHPVLPEEDFVRVDGIAFLQGSNGELKSFCNRVLYCQLEKRPDFVAKTRQGYIVGEAKFITTGGGNQDKSFR
ncbi:MAG: restriction endonuclease, partial [Armatimonadota bacterium]